MMSLNDIYKLISLDQLDDIGWDLNHWPVVYGAIA